MDRVEVATGVFLLNERDELLIVTGSKFPDWVVPGGRIEPGEKMLDCARRELKEETGIDCSGIKLLGVNEVTHRVISGVARHFVYVNTVCRMKSPKVVLDGRELDSFDWVPLAAASRDERISPDIRFEVVPALEELVRKGVI